MHLNDKEIIVHLSNALKQPDRIEPQMLTLLLKESRKRIQRFERIMEQSDKQLIEQVHHVEKQMQLRLDNERMLAQQAKHAALGEMMDAVAHQWKQPLNAISMLTDLLLIDFDDGIVDKQYLQTYKDDLWGQIDHLLNTLSEFRTFFRPNKTDALFSIKKAIDVVLLLTKDEFMKNAITITVQGEENLELFGIENEFKHIVLNIINNAKDAFKTVEVPSRQITITIQSERDIVTITFQDNAGGIPKAILPDIFKPNVTSKSQSGGTGIGLYMSMQIAQKLGAQLRAQNHKEGACFTLKVPIPKSLK